MKVERFITIYSNNTETVVDEINIDKVDLESLKKIVGSEKDDPLLYSAYEINTEKGLRINQLLLDPIKYEFNKYSYFIECYQAS